MGKQMEVRTRLDSKIAAEFPDSVIQESGELAGQLSSLATLSSCAASKPVLATPHLPIE